MTGGYEIPRRISRCRPRPPICRRDQADHDQTVGHHGSLCGQTHAIVKFGIDELLPKQLTLIHGPGCPVCVTPVEIIDQALEIAARPDVIFASFGDMLRVPGSTTDLLSVQSQWRRRAHRLFAARRREARHENPAKEVVFFAVGFETTAPATAMAVFQAAQKGLKNFSLLVSHVLVPPAMEALLSSPNCRVQGFLAAGHVCTVMDSRNTFPSRQSIACRSW